MLRQAVLLLQLDQILSREHSSQPSDDLMQITGPAVYEKFTITSKDNNKEVSMIGGITDFQYFEDLHSPTYYCYCSGNKYW